MWYALVTFGPSLNCPKVHRTAEEAAKCLSRVRADTAGGGRYASDPAAIASVRIYSYRTRAEARKADISDRQ